MVVAHVDVVGIAFFMVLRILYLVWLCVESGLAQWEALKTKYPVNISSGRVKISNCRCIGEVSSVKALLSGLPGLHFLLFSEAIKNWRQERPKLCKTNPFHFCYARNNFLTD